MILKRQKLYSGEGVYRPNAPLRRKIFTDLPTRPYLLQQREYAIRFKNPFKFISNKIGEMRAAREARMIKRHNYNLEREVNKPNRQNALELAMANGEKSSRANQQKLVRGADGKIYRSDYQVQVRKDGGVASGKGKSEVRTPYKQSLRDRWNDFIYDLKAKRRAGSIKNVREGKLKAQQDRINRYIKNTDEALRINRQNARYNKIGQGARNLGNSIRSRWNGFRQNLGNKFKTRQQASKLSAAEQAEAASPILGKKPGTGESIMMGVKSGLNRFTNGVKNVGGSIMSGAKSGLNRFTSGVQNVGNSITSNFKAIKKRGFRGSMDAKQRLKNIRADRGALSKEVNQMNEFGTNYATNATRDWGTAKNKFDVRYNNGKLQYTKAGQTNGTELVYKNVDTAAKNGAYGEMASAQRTLDNTSRSITEKRNAIYDKYFPKQQPSTTPKQKGSTVDTSSNAGGGSKKNQTITAEDQRIQNLNNSKNAEGVKNEYKDPLNPNPVNKSSTTPKTESNGGNGNAGGGEGAKNQQSSQNKNQQQNEDKNKGGSWWKSVGKGALTAGKTTAGVLGGAGVGILGASMLSGGGKKDNGAY